MCEFSAADKRRFNFSHVILGLWKHQNKNECCWAPGCSLLDSSSSLLWMCGAQVRVQFMFPERRGKLVPCGHPTSADKRPGAQSARICSCVLVKVFFSVCVCDAAFRETTLQWRWDHGPGTNVQKSQRTPCPRSSVYPAGTVSSDQAQSRVPNILKLSDDDDDDDYNNHTMLSFFVSCNSLQ